MPARAVAPSRTLALMAFLICAGCGTVSTAQYRAMTAGLIGCPSEEVTVSDEKNVIWASDGIEWRAECRGHRFICSHSGTAQCKEELLPATGAASAPGAEGASVRPASAGSGK